jgi:serine/threonine protein kinase
MILLSLKHLDDKGIIHRNLNSKAILIDELKNGFKILKISEFG